MSQAIWMILFVFLVTHPIGIENAKISGKELSKVFSGDVWKYLSNNEQTNSRRFDQLEARLTRTLDERIQQVNQSSSIAYVERMLHFINEEFAINLEKIEKYEDQLVELRRQNQEQQVQIDDLKRKLEELLNIASKLSSGGQDNKRDDGTGSEGDRGVTTEEISTSVPLPIDCQDAFDSETVESTGLYTRYLKPRLSPVTFKTACYVNQSGDVWTVIQRRVDGSEDFYRTWNDYKQGFGNTEGEFWLGNDHIYQLTNQAEYRLRIEMKRWNDETRWAEYRHFRISDEADKYRLSVTGYRGDAGNSLSSQWDNDHNGQPFSTYDNDNDDRFYDNCAEHFRGAWWFRSCFECHLNGVYYPNGSHSNFFVRNGIQWNSIHAHESLKEVTMMISQNDPEQRLTNGIEPEDT